MKILAVDTCSNACSVAVYADGNIISEKSEEKRSKQAEVLVPLIEDALKDTNISYNDLDALAATIGPGSFTGARIGLSALKGIRTVCDKPLIGISTLEAAAFKAISNKSHESDLITVLIDAKRGQFFTQTFSNSLELKAKSEPLLIEESEVKKQNGHIVVSNIDLPIADIGNIVFTANDVAKIAEKRINEGEQKNAQTPLYVRSPDAKLPQTKEN